VDKDGKSPLQTVIDADTKEIAIQRLGQMDIELRCQSLLIAETQPGKGAKAGNHMGNGLLQALSCC
jgi:hypothetical protein